MQVGVFSVGYWLPLVQLIVVEVSRIDLKLTLDLGSVDHFFGI